MQQYFDEQDRLVHESCGVFLIKADSKLLLFRRTKFPYLLTIPAGHLVIGEDPKTAALRETREEVGIALSRLEKIFEGVIEGDSCQGGADIHHWNAFAGVVDNTVNVTLDSEGTSWGWFDRRELTEHNTVQPVLHLLAQEKVAFGLASLLRPPEAGHATVT
ncbi:NUDIX hydrolase [Candidatus Saccharibacteria bacterium]|nr:NUDIX hydrolase [Candidatus Saccharibacteria bacterium]